MKYLLMVLLVFGIIKPIPAQDVDLPPDCAAFVQNFLEEFRRQLNTLTQYREAGELQREKAARPKVRKDFFAVEQPYIETYYSGTKQNLSTFLQEVATYRISDIKLQFPEECSICTSRYNEKFIAVDVDFHYRSILSGFEEQSSTVLLEIRLYKSSSWQGKIQKMLRTNYFLRTECQSVEESEGTVDSGSGEDSGGSTDYDYDGETERLGEAIAEAESRIAELTNEVDKLRSQNGQQRQTIRAQQQKIEEQEQEIAAQEQEIAALNATIEILRDSVAYLTSIVDCVQDIADNRRDLANNARADLDQADRDYQRFLTIKDDPQEEQFLKDSLVLAAWEVYNRYPVTCDTITCGPLIINNCDDYKQGQDHLNTALIIAYNYGNVMDGMGPTLCEKINKSNELLLAELGQALAKGPYDVRSRAKDLKERIPYLVVNERRCETEGSDIIREIEQIPVLFEAEEYAAAMALYNKFERILPLKEIQGFMDLVDRVNYSAGAILAWNLGDIETNAVLAFDRSWLGEKIDSRRQVGRELLIKVKDRTTNAELKTKAYVILKKQFSPRLIGKN